MRHTVVPPLCHPEPVSLLAWDVPGDYLHQGLMHTLYQVCTLQPSPASTPTYPALYPLQPLLHGLLLGGGQELPGHGGPLLRVVIGAATG